MRMKDALGFDVSASQGTFHLLTLFPLMQVSFALRASTQFLTTRTSHLSLSSVRLLSQKPNPLLKRARPDEMALDPTPLKKPKVARAAHASVSASSPELLPSSSLSSATEASPGLLIPPVLPVKDSNGSNQPPTSRPLVRKVPKVTSRVSPRFCVF